MVQVSSSSPGRFRQRSPRRFLLGGSASFAAATAAVAFVALSAVPAAASAGAPPPVRDEDRAGDHLTVTVRHAGGGRDGTYELYCHPRGGSHPDARGACRVLDRTTRWGRDTFAPVPDDSACTLQYGGPATARVTGTWAGRPVDAAYDRRDGCEIDRWNRLVPVLPDLGS
ncbi:SSI family serine proteinase inhibitor [Streptomyces sp. NPDC021356]|uniref:SSI family serine proteinase inhibitor n=1 Tax=Streptomyces sp. NPDC021356 TaxID=3154900 RepID=UPI00340D4641